MYQTYALTMQMLYIVLVSFTTSIIQTFTDFIWILVSHIQIAQVHAVFQIPPKFMTSLFHSGIPLPKHLAYVEWFSKFHPTPEQNYDMYKVNHLIKDGRHVASIIPVYRGKPCWTRKTALWSQYQSRESRYYPNVCNESWWEMPKDVEGCCKMPMFSQLLQPHHCPYVMDLVTLPNLVVCTCFIFLIKLPATLLLFIFLL
jgi:hypothetical protein